MKGKIKSKIGKRNSTRPEFWSGVAKTIPLCATLVSGINFFQVYM